MNILIISHQFALENSTGSLRMRAFHKYLKNHGINTFVVTSGYRNPDKNTICFSDKYSEKSCPLRYYGWRIFIKIFALLGVPMTSYFHWKRNVFRSADEILKKTNPSAIIASYPSIENLEVGLFLSEKYRVPLISDFRDGLMFEPIAQGALKINSYYKYYDNIERECLNKSRIIMSVTDPISDYFNGKHPSGRVITLSNGYDFSDLSFPEINLGKKINIVHTGGLAASQPGRSSTLSKLIKALDYLNDSEPEVLKRICIHFVGHLTATEKKKLQPLAERDVVRIHGAQSRAYAVACQRKADALLLIVPSNIKSVATGKVFEYVATRNPILAFAKGTSAEKIVISSGLGILIDEEDQEQIVLSILNFINHKIKIIPNNSYIDSLSRELQVEQLSKELKSIAIA